MPRRNQQAFDTVTIKPLTGILDARSFPQDVPLGAFRYKQNFDLVNGTKLCCRAGWERLFSGSSYSLLGGDPNVNPPVYTNFDWHDQSDINGQNAREPITMLFEATTNPGKRYLYAGTQSKIAWLDETKGVWTIVATGKGGAAQPGVPQTRFKAAELQETIIFTNNVDPIYQHDVASGAVSTIPELANGPSPSLNVSAAAVVIEYSGFILLMNIVEDGVRKSSRVRWSDLNRPTVWVGPTDSHFSSPDDASLADFTDLDYGSEILGAVGMAGSLYVFTTHAIWRGFISGTAPAFSFVKVYEEKKNGAKCLAFPNSLVSTGNAVYYAASDAIYYFDPYLPEPERQEWLYRGGSQMFEGATDVDPACCQNVVAEVFPDDSEPDGGEVWVSWPVKGSSPNCVETRTLVFDYRYKSVDYVDHGFTAFGNYRPSPGDGVSCSKKQTFIAASAVDNCLKQMGTAFSRERLTNLDAQGQIKNGIYIPFSPAYAIDGYYRIIRGLFPFQNFDREKEVKKILLETHPVDQAVPCVVRLRVGVSYSEADPNLPDGKCSVLWFQMKDMPLKCLDSMTNVQYVATNIYRAVGTEWDILVRGRFIFYEFTIANADGSPAIGGASCFSRIESSTRVLLPP